MVAKCVSWCIVGFLVCVYIYIYTPCYLSSSEMGIESAGGGT